jgi:hypothetical protein
MLFLLTFLALVNCRRSLLFDGIDIGIGIGRGRMVSGLVSGGHGLSGDQQGGLQCMACGLIIGY